MPGDINKQVVLKLGVEGENQVNDAMKKVAGGTAGYSKSVSELTSQLTGLRSTMGSLAQQFGAGSFGSLLGATTLAGATLAVGAIMAQAMRMAYVFEETSARAAASLSIGGGSVSGAYTALQGQARNGLGQRYGYSPDQRVAGMAAYQQAAGADLSSTVASDPVLMRYARAFGMTPEEVGSAVGGVSRITREGAGRAAGGLFGGAEEAGPLGRDIRAFLGTTTAVLQHLAMGAPNVNFTAAQAAGYVADLSRQGGVYSTPQAIQTLAGGLASLTQGNAMDPQRMAIALSAGIPVSDIILGNDDPRNQAKMVRRIQQLGGGPGTLRTKLMMSNMMGQQAAQLWFGESPQAQQRWMSDAMSGHGAPLAVDAEQRAQQIMSTGFGEIAKKVADFQTHMIDLGEKEIDQLDNLLKRIPDGAIAGILNYMPMIFGGLVALNVVLGGAKLLGGLLGRGAIAAAGEEAAGAVGVGAAGILAGVAAMLSMKGDSGPGSAVGADDTWVTGKQKSILEAITGTESHGYYGATNGFSGASGRYQFMPGTAKSYVPASWIQRYGNPFLGSGTHTRWNTASSAYQAWRNNAGGIQDIAASGMYGMLEAHAYGLSHIHDNAALIMAGWYGGTGGMDEYFHHDPRAFAPQAGGYESIAEYVRRTVPKMTQSETVSGKDGSKFQITHHTTITQVSHPTTSSSRTNSINTPRIPI